MIGLYFLLVIVIWCWLTWRIFRLGGKLFQADVAMRALKIMLFSTVAIVWFGVSFWYGGGMKIYYDAQVRELCAKDGGVKVYEVVKLPGEKFDKYGQINFYKPTKGENALGAEYVLKTDVQFIQSGNPSLRRYHVQVIRHRDGFLLGESIGYDRGGGDLPGPWQPSSFSCPKHHGESVIDKIFVLTQGEQK